MTCQVTPNPAKEKDPVTFVAQRSGCTDACSMSWNFGDGTSDTGTPVIHIYQNDGTYTATGTLSDSGRAVDCRTIVEVQDQ